MSDTKVGVLIDETAQRDAIHIAVAPVISSGNYRPGEHVGFMPDGRVGIRAEKKIGIVDPFLENGVCADEWCYVFLYPQTVTGIRHHWSHPAFKECDSKKGEVVTAPVSEAWLKDYVRSHCPYWENEADGGYSQFIHYVENQRWIFYNGSDCHSLADVENPEELFHHLGIVLGKKIDSDYFEAFTCSC